MTQTAIQLALFPKSALTFLIREYLSPLSNGERMLIVATFLASFVSAYGVQSHLAGAYSPIVGWIGAATLELIYLGAALAGTSAKHRDAGRPWGIIAALALAALLAITFNLAHQIEQRGTLSWFAGIEAVGFPLVALLCAFVSHGLAGERIADLRTIEDEDRQRQLEEETALRQLQADYRRQKMEIDLEAEKARQAEHVRALRRELRTGVQTDVQHTVQRTGVQGCASALDSEKRQVCKERIAHALHTAAQTGEQVNKSELARDLGINRREVYRIIDEIVAEEAK